MGISGSLIVHDGGLKELAGMGEVAGGHYVVTGCAGFIAARVAGMLLDAGHRVTGLDNLSDAYDPRLKRWRLELLADRPGFAFHELDIADRSAVDRCWSSLGRVDGVLNLAARAGVRASVENPWVYVDTNMTGTLNLLEAARRSEVERFVLASTSSLYAGSTELPFRESAASNRPLSPYAATKKGAEALAFTYHHLYGIRVCIPRYFTVYGPMGRPDMSVFRFVRQIAEGETLTVMGDGHQQRDFTYVDDIARGTIAGLKVDGYEIVNLGGSRMASIQDVIGLIEGLVGRKARVEHQPFHAADMQATWADNAKAQQLLGWSPTVSLSEGLRRTVEWYREHRERIMTIGL